MARLIAKQQAGGAPLGRYITAHGPSMSRLLNSAGTIYVPLVFSSEKACWWCQDLLISITIISVPFILVVNIWRTSSASSFNHMLPKWVAIGLTQDNTLFCLASSSGHMPPNLSTLPVVRTLPIRHTWSLWSRSFVVQLIAELHV